MDDFQPWYFDFYGQDPARPEQERVDDPFLRVDAAEWAELTGQLIIEGVRPTLWPRRGPFGGGSGRT